MVSNSNLWVSKWHTLRRKVFEWMWYLHTYVFHVKKSEMEAATKGAKVPLSMNVLGRIRLLCSAKWFQVSPGRSKNDLVDTKYFESFKDHKSFFFSYSRCSLLLRLSLRNLSIKFLFSIFTSMLVDSQYVWNVS